MHLPFKIKREKSTADHRCCQYSQSCIDTEYSIKARHGFALGRHTTQLRRELTERNGQKKRGGKKLSETKGEEIREKGQKVFFFFYFSSSLAP